jgi:two-component system, cell cycle response regulator CpdR
MARILLADDEPASRDLVRRALEQDGHSVAVMPGGVEALECLTRAPGDFDLLVSDVNMPGLDGMELAAESLGLNPGLRLVLMSGFVEQLERAKTLKTAKIGTISKPFSLDQMRTLVRKVLDQ